MALPRGFRNYLSFVGEDGIVFFTIPGGAKYKISVIGPNDKLKPEKYPEGLPEMYFIQVGLLREYSDSINFLFN